MTSTLIRGPVWTGAREAASLLVVDGLVAAVDQPDASADVVVDLDGATLLPAFVDAHVHATAAGMALLSLDLSGCRTRGELLARVGTAATAQRGRPVLGTGWDETRWPGATPPTRQELDRASYGGLVYLARVDVHSAVASSALMAAVPGLRDLPGFRDDGWLTLDAHHAVRQVATGTITTEARAAAQRALLEHAAAHGVAAVHEMAGPEVSGEADLVELLARSGPAHGHPEVVGCWGSLGDLDTPRRLGLRTAGGDLFCDGSIGSHTAALREPYADAPHCGQLKHDQAQIAAHVDACVRAGLQAGFHAIGDAALDAVLGAFEAAAAEHGTAAVRAGRHRVEHAELLRPEHVDVMGRLGLVASVQPVFDELWGGPHDLYSQRLGRSRAAAMNPFAALRAAGAPIALSSDAPVTPVDPWRSVRAAVRHQTPGSALDVATAMGAATRGGWWAAGDDDSGLLEPGRPATYAVWDGTGSWRDWASGAAPAPACTATVVRGAPVFTRDATAQHQHPAAPPADMRPTDPDGDLR